MDQIESFYVPISLEHSTETRVALMTLTHVSGAKICPAFFELKDLAKFMKGAPVSWGAFHAKGTSLLMVMNVAASNGYTIKLNARWTNATPNKPSEIIGDKDITLDDIKLR